MADRRERLLDPTGTLLAAMTGHQAGVWTALPGIVNAFDAVKMTVSVVPAVKARVLGADGVADWVTLPLLVDCPVLFPGGGGFTLTFPVAVGDECLVLFASRCIDAWWDSSQVSVQPDMRMHDLSDGFALVGVRSRPKAVPGVSTNGAELRNNDRSSFIRIAADGSVSVASSSIVTITAPSVVMSGDLDVGGIMRNNGRVVGEHHKHSGVRSGGDISGEPI